MYQYDCKKSEWSKQAEPIYIGGASLGGPTIAGTVPVKEGELHRLEERLSTILVSLQGISGVARSIADRLLGTQPEAVNKSDQPKPHCALSRLHELCGFIETNAQEIGVSIHRIDHL